MWKGLSALLVLLVLLAVWLPTGPIQAQGGEDGLELITAANVDRLIELESVIFEDLESKTSYVDLDLSRDGRWLTLLRCTIPDPDAYPPLKDCTLSVWSMEDPLTLISAQGMAPPMAEVALGDETSYMSESMSIDWSVTPDGHGVFISQSSPARYIDFETAAITYTPCDWGYAAISPDGRLLACSSSIGSYLDAFDLWDLTMGVENLWNIQPEGPSQIMGVPRFLEGDANKVPVFSPDSSLLAAQRATGIFDTQETTIWDVSTGEVLYELPDAAGVGFSPGSDRAAFSQNSQLFLLELTTGATQILSNESIGSFLNFPEFIFNKDGTIVATNVAHGILSMPEYVYRFWDSSNGHVLRDLHDISSPGIFSSDGLFLYFVDADTLSVWGVPQASGER